MLRIFVRIIAGRSVRTKNRYVPSSFSVLPGLFPRGFPRTCVDVFGPHLFVEVFFGSRVFARAAVSDWS